MRIWSSIHARFTYVHARIAREQTRMTRESTRMTCTLVLFSCDSRVVHTRTHENTREWDVNTREFDENDTRILTWNSRLVREWTRIWREWHENPHISYENGRENGPIFTREHSHAILVWYENDTRMDVYENDTRMIRESSHGILVDSRASTHAWFSSDTSFILLFIVHPCLWLSNIVHPGCD